MMREVMKIKLILGEEASFTLFTSEWPLNTVRLAVPAQLPLRGELLITILTLVFL